MAVKAHVMLTPFDATTGAALTGATVNVFQPGTVTPVAGTLFDKNGNTLTNPLTSDGTTGLVDFYMNVAQEVDLQVAKSGYTTRTYSNVPVLDDASFDLSALMTVTGDIVYASSANTPARLALASNLSVLGIAAGLPAWSAAGGANQALLVNAAGNALIWGPPAWTVWTPTLTQGVGVTLTANWAHYSQVGKLVTVQLEITATSAGTIANDIVVGGFPVVPAAFNTQFAVGTFRFDGAATRVGAVCMVTGSTFKFQIDNQAGFLGTAPSLALANGNILAFQATFEAN